MSASTQLSEPGDAGFEVVITDEGRERLALACRCSPDGYMEQLTHFLGIAARHPGVPFIVPPDVDQTLHELLAGRNEHGGNLYEIRAPGGCTGVLVHVIKSSYNGVDAFTFMHQTFGELDFPQALQTQRALAGTGIRLDQTATYDREPPCYLTVKGILD